MVIYGSFKVVNRNIVAESARRDVVVFENRSTSETNAMCCREKMHHILGISAVLSSMRLIAHKNNVMLRNVRSGIRFIEFMNKSEDIRRIIFQTIDEVLTA